MPTILKLVVGATACMTGAKGFAAPAEPLMGNYIGGDKDLYDECVGDGMPKEICGEYVDCVELEELDDELNCGLIIMEMDCLNDELGLNDENCFLARRRQLEAEKDEPNAKKVLHAAEQSRGK